MDIAVPTLEDIAAILALAPPDLPWKLEGPCRHRIRAILILTRWTRSWHRADLEARRLVARGRLKNGVRMPAGWDADTDLSSWVGTIECAICGKTVLQKIHNQTYCSQPCKTRANYIGATKVRLQRCSRCGALFEGGSVEAKYCSTACRYATLHERKKLYARIRRASANGLDFYDRPCAICGGPIPETFTLLAQFCSEDCRRENRLRYKRAAYRRHRLSGTNGHDHARPNGAGGHAGHDADPRPDRGDRRDGGARTARAACELTKFL